MRTALMSVVVLLGVTVASAECKFDKMLKVVVRNVTPGVSRSSFAGQPKTIYRLGTQYGRTEEAPDPEQGIHGLIIVNEPDSWMINLLTKTGQHIIDRGAPYHLHDPILWSEGMPDSLREFEFGCELAFMKANASGPPEPRVIEGEKELRYEMVADKYRVVLFVGRKDKEPRAVVLMQDGKAIYALRYDSWEDGLTPDLNLFQTVDGIKFEEAK